MERIARLEHDLGQYSRLLSAFTRAVIAKGATTQDELDRKWATITTPSIWNGGRIVARAWTDPAFKERLLIQPREAVRDLGIPPGRLGQLWRGREHGLNPQRRRLHPLLVLPVQPAGRRALVVQARQLPRPRRARPARHPHGDVRFHRAGARAGPRLGQHVRYPLDRHPAPAGHRGLERGGAGPAGHPGEPDRRGGGADARAACPGRPAAAAREPIGGAARLSGRGRHDRANPVL